MGAGSGRLTSAAVAACAALALAGCGAGAATDAATGSAPEPAPEVDRGAWLAADRERREELAAEFIDANPQLCPTGLGARQLALYVSGTIAAERDDRGNRSLDLPVEPVLEEWCVQSQGSG